MKTEDFKNIIREVIREELTKIMNKDEREELCEGEGCLDEKSVPQPYDRKGARKMTKSQIEIRKKIGKSMMRDEKKVSMFRKKYGDEWKDYLWAAASSAAFRQSGSTKSHKRKKVNEMLAKMEALTDKQKQLDVDKDGDIEGDDLAKLRTQSANEGAPEGWEKTVLAMKKHKEIDNPWALAHWMKKKGYRSQQES